ncbi:MAG: NADH-quinone oxidoreductase subunit M, partial [Planctomycetaceae bacterium]|nr:NADH-quinone oxidoreductase subunit M [Planctomycetaceae bacterium]
MDNADTILLSLTIFLPTIGALVLLAFDKAAVEAMRTFSLVVTVATFGLTIAVLFKFLQLPDGAETYVGNFKMEVVKAWIPAWNIEYRLGVDGISLPLVLLTSLVSMLAMMASWSIEKQVRGYLILFLLLETGMLGTFLALDFFLFYVFWEVMLLPMYFLIGVWGGPRREYAAIKFFLYTLGGSVLLLIAMLMFYFQSNGSFNIIHLTQLAEQGQLLDGNIQLFAFILL